MSRYRVQYYDKDLNEVWISYSNEYVGKTSLSEVLKSDFQSGP